MTTEQPTEGMKAKVLEECEHARPLYGSVYCDIKFKSPREPNINCIIKRGPCPRGRKKEKFNDS